MDQIVEIEIVYEHVYSTLSWIKNHFFRKHTVRG